MTEAGRINDFFQVNVSAQIDYDSYRTA
jgi:hypothetical protein